jgi:hypothetical protein
VSAIAGAARLDALPRDLLADEPRERLRKVTTTMGNQFDSIVYSEALYTASESEYDEVMRLMIAKDFSGYSEWSREIESDQVVQESENYRVRASCKVEYKGEGLKSNRI